MPADSKAVSTPIDASLENPLLGLAVIATIKRSFVRCYFKVIRLGRIVSRCLLVPRVRRLTDGRTCLLPACWSGGDWPIIAISLGLIEPIIQNFVSLGGVYPRLKKSDGLGRKRTGATPRLKGAEVRRRDFPLRVPRLRAGRCPGSPARLGTPAAPTRARQVFVVIQ